MKLTLTRIILPVAAIAVALGLISCGGNGTVSPTNLGGAQPITLAISPQDTTVSPNVNQQFTATVTGTSNTTVTWTLTNTGLKQKSINKSGPTATHNWGIPASITAQGLFSAGTSDGDYTVTCTLNADPSITASTPITVSGEPAIISVTPDDNTIDEGLTQQFTATVEGAPQGPITWAMVSGGGTINQSGVYTSPFSATFATVRASLTSNPQITGTATINVNGQEDIVRKVNALNAASKAAFKAKAKN